MKLFTTTIDDNRPIARDIYRMTFAWPRDATAPVAGQFITIRARESTDPLLRRPFAFSSYSAETGIAGIVYLRRGPATEILAGKKPEDELDVLGPLGNRFPPPQPGRGALLVGGGIGIGPILFAYESLRRAGVSARLILGARTADLLPGTDDGDAILCTDDGSLGFRGTVVDALRSTQEYASGRSTIYACGPQVMLAACAKAAEEVKTPCWVSMEQIMACGVGACMGCVVPVKGKRKFARVCAEGPVFDATEVLWTTVL